MTNPIGIGLEQQLFDLIKKWEKVARASFSSASSQQDDFGRRFIEHGAMCYVNCSTDLKKVLTSAVLLLSTTQGEDQK
jgi:hypothetical protein